MIYRKIKKADFGEWLEMRKMLWPKDSEKALKYEMKKIFSLRNQEVFVGVDENSVLAGFIEASIRHDSVFGLKFGMPAGYIEGLFVKKTYRRSGIAEKLVKHAENWAREKGCSQIGSDTRPRNKKSRAFHKKMGYKETDIIVHFIKNI